MNRAQKVRVSEVRKESVITEKQSGDTGIGAVPTMDLQTEFLI